MPYTAKQIDEGGSAHIYLEALHGERRATKYPKKVSSFRCSMLWTALERQDLSRTYLAHHELESIVVIVIMLMLMPAKTSLLHAQVISVAQQCNPRSSLTEPL